MKNFQVKVVDADIAQKLLLDIGISPDKTGYTYLLACIQCFRDKSRRLMEIYRIVAKSFNVKPTNVERCVRFAVRIAFSKGSFIKLNKYFNYELFGAKTYMYNGDFIATVATYLDMINAPRMRIVVCESEEE